MSSLLTWHTDTLAAQLGTTTTDYLTDLESLISGNSGDANFKWEVADSDLVSTIKFVSLRKKDLSDGRILVLAGSSFAASNPHLVKGSGTLASNQIYVAYFPNATSDTPANIDSGSGNVYDDDTDCTKCQSNQSIFSIYPAGVLMYYFDSEEALYVFTQNPAGATSYGWGAGLVFVDGADNALPGTMTGGANNWASWGTNGGAVFPWNPLSYYANLPVSGAVGMVVDAGVQKLVFNAFLCGSWGSQAPGSGDDPMIDTSSQEITFIPVPLMTQTKNDGLKYKFRQMAYGPRASGAMDSFNETGPVVKAIQANNYATANDCHPWFVNFKI